MSPEQFLSLLEDRQLLAANHIASLRRQIAESTKEVTAESVAKLLVKKEMLTKFQAKQLLQTKILEANDPSETIVSSEEVPPDPPGEAELRELDDLDLSPMENDLEAPPPLVASPASEPTTDEPTGADTPTSDVADDVPLGSEGPLRLEKLEPIVDEDAAEVEPAPLDDDLSNELTPLDDELAPLDDDLASTGDGILDDGGLDDGAMVGELLDDEEYEETQPPTGASPLAAAGKDKLGRRMKVQVGSAKNEWDTPLMLVGGGALAVLLLIGAVTYYLLYSSSGDEIFNAAESQYYDGSYTNAIKNYDKLLKDYPGHASVSLARVHSEMATLRLTMLDDDWRRTWEAAQQVVEKVSAEPDFHEVHEELATILPDIADHLTQDAMNAEEAASADRSIKLATEAISMIERTDIVPRKLRDEGGLKRIRDALDLIRRDMASDVELINVLNTMQREFTAGNVAAAYAAHKQLIDQYPDLKSNEKLSEMVRRVAEAEVQTVRAAEQRQEARNEEPTSPVIASVAMANRLGESFPAAARHVALFQIQGAVYAFDAATGKLLWRRHVGVDYTLHPVSINDRPDSDELLVDVHRNELLRVDSRTGELRWRYSVGQRFTTPVIAGRHALVADRSGRLTAIDLDSGDSPRHAIFPQPLSIAPAVHPNGKFAYQVGEHSSLYLISTADLACQQVVYQGHAAGTISVPPVVVLRHVLLVENWGEKSSTLHVFKTNAEGAELEHVDEVRLAGRVQTPLIVDRRRVIVVTDRGQMKVFEIGTDGGASPLVPVAERAATDDEPKIHFTALVGDQLWVADTDLAKFVVQAAGGRLASHPFDQRFEGDAFDYPLQMIGELLIVVRRPAGQAGWFVSALDTQSGRAVWETQIAVPPAGSPWVSVSPPRITVANSAGALFRLDASAIKQRVQDQPLTARVQKNSPVLAARIDLGDGRKVFTAVEGSDTVLVYNPSASSNALQWRSLPDQLTCVPSAFQSALIAPMRNGQVFWIDPSTGQPSGTPFQPTLTPSESLPWRTPAVMGDNADALVLADGRTKLYVVGLVLGVGANPSQLVAQAESDELAVPIVSGVAVVGSVAYAADAENFLVSFALPDIKLGPRTNLDAAVAWGPRRVGDYVLIATAQNELLCFGETGEPLWRVSLGEGPLAGDPLAEGNDFILATKSGTVSRINALSGQQLNKVNLGQPLASGPVPFGKQWVLVGHDGTLLVMNRATGS